MRVSAASSKLKIASVNFKLWPPHHPHLHLCEKVCCHLRLKSHRNKMLRCWCVGERSFCLVLLDIVFKQIYEFAKVSNNFKTIPLLHKLMLLVELQMANNNPLFRENWIALNMNLTAIACSPYLWNEYLKKNYCNQTIFSKVKKHKIQAGYDFSAWLLLLGVFLWCFTVFLRSWRTKEFE